MNIELEDDCPCLECSLKRRIAELEAYNATRTDELLAATSRIAELEARTDALGADLTNQLLESADEFNGHHEAMLNLIHVLQGERDRANQLADSATHQVKLLESRVLELQAQINAEPVFGKNYEAGLWSRRNYEAMMEDRKLA